jgi:hypothetical protein
MTDLGDKYSLVATDYVKGRCQVRTLLSYLRTANRYLVLGTAIVKARPRDTTPTPEFGIPVKTVHTATLGALSDVMLFRRPVQ